MKTLKYLSPILIFISILSCEDINLQTADTNVAVVESYIHPGAPIEITIKKQLVFNVEDTTSAYLNDLEVYVLDNEDTYLLTNTEDGKYVNPQLQIKSGTDYTLTFNYNNKQVKATTTVPSKPEAFAISASSIEVVSMSGFGPGSGLSERPDPVEISYNNPDDHYHIIVVECIESSLQLINSSTDRPTRSFRSRPEQGSLQMLDPMQFTYYGTHQIILYRLNAEYADLYEQIEATSLDIEAPPSNVENGLGIFTGINSDTLIVEVVAQ